MIMGITITKLKMWKNPGYTKGCVNVPPSGSKKLPTPDYTLTAGQTLRPRKNSTISAIELPLSFCQVFEMSYLYMEFHDTANNQVKIFGWIDSIEQTASSDEAVLIRWDVDWWRTYSGSVSYGIGKITRCEEKSYRRPPTIQPRYNVFSKFAEITDTFNTIWCIMVYSQSQSSVTWVKTAVFPVGSRATGHILENIYTTPSLQDCYNGRLDERLGLDPQQISGIWFSPICPCDQVVKRTDSGGVDYYDFTAITVGQSTINSGYGVPWVDVESIARHEVFIQGTGDVITDYDLRTFGVCDFQGALAGTFPWHSGTNNDHDLDVITPGFIFARIESGTTSAFLVVYQKGTRFTSAQDSKLAGSSGCMIKIPLPTAPVNTNAMSTYVYSGQRQADIETAKVNQDQKFVNNLLGVGSGALSGSIGGAMTGKGVSGAVVGSAIGTGVALGSAFISNWAESEFRDRLQGINDKAHANQSSQMLLPGDGLLWFKMFPHPYVVKIEADPTTSLEYSRMISANGYETEMFDSPSTLISQGGAIQVTDLNLTGNIPPQAKSFIKAMFEKGVKLVEMNPSGVVP